LETPDQIIELAARLRANNAFRNAIIGRIADRFVCSNGRVQLPRPIARRGDCRSCDLQWSNKQ